ncbi:MAG: (2Fe-2S) ferredoxin domain-containing protein [Pelagibacteraceae bacterium]
MFFEKHVFCCINKRSDSIPKGCCSLKNSEKLHIELKLKIKDLKLNKKIRINKSGCLDRCELGPVMVIYPEGVWYSFKNSEDIDEILNSHLLKNKVVERLKI